MAAWAKRSYAQARVDARITRIQAGLFGNCKPVGDGVFGLKGDFGSGYRIYFAEDGKEIILLLCAGDKSNQQTDIGTAKNYWTDHQRRKKQTKSNEKKRNVIRRYLRERLKNPEYAAEYLNAVLNDDEEGGDAAFLLALRNVAEAFQISNIAQKADLNRENLYRILSGRGNPKLSSLFAILRALGLKLSVQNTHKFCVCNRGDAPDICKQ